MTDWIELPGFPKVYPSKCAPWGSVVRLVDGVAQQKNGKPVTLSGAKAFAQRLEQALIAAHAETKDVPALVSAVLDAHASHIDLVEWVRVRGDEIDLSLRIYASTGSTRLHLSLAGPVGRYADRPLPERTAPPAARARAKKPDPAPAAAAAPPARMTPPEAPLLLRPIVPGATPSYVSPIAFDRDGRLHVALQLPDTNDYQYAVVEPTGAVTLTPLPTRDALRAGDPGAMTGGLMPQLHETPEGLLCIEHYDTARGMKARIGLRRDGEQAGHRHASLRGLAQTRWVLGLRGDWLLECIVLDEKTTLFGAHLPSDKRTRIALPAGLVARGAALDRGPDHDLLRIVDGAGKEHRLPLRVSHKLELDVAAATVVAHGQEGVVAPVPNGNGWVSAEWKGDRCRLRFAGEPGASTELFVLPTSFTAPGYQPWNVPELKEIWRPTPSGATVASWLCTFDFGSDHGPRCTGAVVFTADGAVRAGVHVDADGALRAGATTLPLAKGEHVNGYAAGPDGDLATLAALRDGLTLLWCPPPA
jgi:hypothetical protein